MERTSVHLRLPPELHAQLRTMADEQELSLNSLVIELLAGATGVDLTHVDPDADEWG